MGLTSAAGCGIFIMGIYPLNKILLTLHYINITIIAHRNPNQPLKLKIFFKKTYKKLFK